VTTKVKISEEMARVANFPFNRGNREHAIISIKFQLKIGLNISIFYNLPKIQ